MAGVIDQTIASTIQDFIGDDMNESLLNGYEDFIAAGFNYVADSIPAQSELWHSNKLNKETPIISATTEINTDTKTTKVIKVTRQHSGDIERVAQEISYEDYLKGAGTTSIFYHGKAVRSPVWSISPNGDLIISPTPSISSKAHAYTFEYIDAAISAKTATQLIADGDGSGQGFPMQAFNAACLKSAMNILHARVSDAVQDDEDPELLQLLQAQMASLDQRFQDEMQRLLVPYKVVGVKDDVK